jgi:hypothetical protein
VIVYALSRDSKYSWRRLPTIVQSALNSPEAGRYIPVAVVVNSGITEVLTIIPYVAGYEERAERLHKVNAKISRHKTSNEHAAENLAAFVHQRAFFYGQYRRMDCEDILPVPDTMGFCRKGQGFF